MPKKGKFKSQKPVNPGPAVVKEAVPSSQSIPATAQRKIAVVGTSSTLNESRIAQRTAMHRSSMSDIKRSVIIGAIIFALLIVIYIIFRSTHFFGIT
jgi:hypothetical protein